MTPRPARIKDLGAESGAVYRIDRARETLERNGGCAKSTTPRAPVPIAERFVRPVQETKPC